MSSIPASSTANINTVATRILLDDAQNGFKDGNFVCSPISLGMLLGMLAAGAEGKTLEQLLEFLGHESIDQLLSESPSVKLLARLLSDQSRGNGKANGLWVDNKVINRFQSCYKEVLKSVYKTEVEFVDFKNEAVRKINLWVKEKIRGLIPSIIDGEALKGDQVIALVNALYFKGLWSDQPFCAYYTREEDFHLLNGETVSVPYMTSTSEFYYGSFEGYKILKIPYESKGQSNRFSMYMFLPHRKDGLQDLLQVFHSDIPALFRTWFCLEPHYMEKLLIPKFKISYKFDAKKVLKQMGLTLPFESTNMEFSRMVEPNVFGDHVYVSKILQKSFIEIDETGTKAATVSYLVEDEDMGFSLPSPPPVRFVVDHPFMFMIREDTSQAVLFIGVVLDPRA